MKVRVFTVIERDQLQGNALERKLQEWLDHNPGIEIKWVAQSAFQHAITVTIFYMEQSQGDEVARRTLLESTGDETIQDGIRRSI